MADTRLAATLTDYSKQLDLHLVNLRERHQQLEIAWFRLRDVYEGEGAQVFAEAFEVASAQLAEYSQQGVEVARHLQIKLEELRGFQSADPEP